MARSDAAAARRLGEEPSVGAVDLATGGLVHATVTPSAKRGLPKRGAATVAFENGPLVQRIVEAQPMSPAPPIDLGQELLRIPVATLREIHDGPALGLLRPGRIARVYARRPAREELEEAGLVTDEIHPEFRIRFTCSGTACTAVHDLPVVDDSLVGRAARDTEKPADFERRVVARMERRLDGSAREVFFLVSRCRTATSAFAVLGLLSIRRLPPPLHRWSQLSLGA